MLNAEGGPPGPEEAFGNRRREFEREEPHAPDYQPMEYYSTAAEEEQGLAEWLATRSDETDGDGSGADIIDLPTGTEAPTE